MEEEVLMETYIDNKKVAEGIMADNDYLDGILIYYYQNENTYSYFILNKGKDSIRKSGLTKKELLKLLQQDN